MSVALTADEIRLLDNPVWHALDGPHAHVAESLGTAYRYHSDVSIFAGLPDEPDARAWGDLARLAGPGATVVLTGPRIEVPSGWEIAAAIPGVQMIDAALDPTPDVEAEVLGADEAAEMAELVAATQPGPWCPRTYELGTYLGIRRGGRLVAMAGERLHPPGWTEVSAVCTDPAYRGQGLAARLVRAVAHTIRSRGDKVFLHAAATNTGAIRLYEQLGFELRSRPTFTGCRALPGPTDD